MKRNLFPFLGIAFVVAIAATGVFYGLFVGKISGATAAAPNHAGVVVASRAIDRGAVLTSADVRLQRPGTERSAGSYGTVEDVVGRTVSRSLAVNEPVLAAGLTGAKGVAALTIPKGMRAISIRVADSTGLVPYLRAGNHIDVQSIRVQSTGEQQVRTLLSNVEVLNVHADQSPQPSPVTVLNLLVPVKDVEHVALADSVSKVRIVLRNAEDKEEVQAAGTRKGTAESGQAPDGPRVSFAVRVAAAGAETVREISSQAGMAPGGEGGMRIGLLPAGWKTEQFERTQSLRMLSTENVDSPQGREVSLQAGRAPRNDFDLRLRLMPRGAGNGMLRVRVRPELTLPHSGGLSSRQFSAELNVADGQSFLVTGFERDAFFPALVEKLFHSSAPQLAGSELLLVVTPRVAAAAR